MGEPDLPSGGGMWDGFGPGAWGPLGDDPSGWGMPGPAGLGSGAPGASPMGPGRSGRDNEPELSGKLLVAAPRMVDPNFARTVVLVLHHDLGGSLGLVLNRPSKLDLDEPLSQWSFLAPTPKVVYVGGPVASAAAICLAQLRERDGGEGAAGGDGPGGGEVAGEGPGGGDGPGGGRGLFELAFETPQGWRSVGGRVGTLDLNGDPAAAALSVDAIRVFAGYAGWGPGQLTAELGLGGWLVADLAEGDAFSTDPGSLWKAVLHRQSGEVAILASYPEDPSAN